MYFRDSVVHISKDTIYYGSGSLVNGFIVLDIDYDMLTSTNESCFSFITSSNSENDDVNIWHARLGHIGQDRMNRLAKEGLLGQLYKVELPIYEHCLVGKTVRKPFE